MAWILVAVFVAGWLTLFNVADEIAAANPPTSLVGQIGSSLAEWQELPAIGRFGQMLDTESRTAKVRVWIWQGALDLITPHDALSFEFGQDEDEPEQGDAEPQVDRAAELQELWQTERGQLWAIGEHRLLVGDSTVRADVERVMGDERAWSWRRWGWMG